MNKKGPARESTKKASVQNREMKIAPQRLTKKGQTQRMNLVPHTSSHAIKLNSFFNSSAE